MTTVIRLLRVQQWAKNLLLVLPALAGHLPWSPALLLTLLAGFFAFCCVASAGYVVNDLIDAPIDREHPEKRHRPIAAGEVPPAAALLVLAGLVSVAVFLGRPLPREFQLALLVYLLLSTSYSVVLKRWLLLDVITLATLYTLRVIAGAALVGVPLSRWFLPFSIFLFFSLALVKRVIALTHPAGAAVPPAGRPYTPGDRQVLVALGAAAAASSALVYCLYITSPDVAVLYRAPDVLWLGLPLLLYWQARVWILAVRGMMSGDPVVFALRDRVSYLVIAVFLATVWLAA